MTLNELKTKLENSNFRRDSYCLNGGLPNESYCIEQQNAEWHVYYSERGRKTGLKTFDDEQQACEYFYSWLHRAIGASSCEVGAHNASELNPLAQAVKRLTGSGNPKLNFGCSDQQLQIFETRWHQQLPSDVRTLYAKFNGFDQSRECQDERGFNVWPMEEIQPLDEYSGGRICVTIGLRMFVFCDYLDFSWGYAFAPTTDSYRSEVYMVGTADGKPQLISHSVIEFLGMIIADDERLYPL